MIFGLAIHSALPDISHDVILFFSIATFQWGVFFGSCDCICRFVGLNLYDWTEMSLHGVTPERQCSTKSSGLALYPISEFFVI